VRPVVHFTLVTHTAPTGTWPFTAQLAEIRENSNGLSGAGEPPQDAYLMVQVDVTSAITARTVPVPKLRVACHAPHEHGWAAGPITGTGWDDNVAESSPDPTGNSISLDDGQPHVWDTEWQVPQGTSTADVICALRSDPPAPYPDGILPTVTWPDPLSSVRLL
jgi:hypothetical protein